MVDPSLNSVHLEAPRRSLFRHARERLLNSCGDYTIGFQRESLNPAGLSEINYDAAIKQLSPDMPRFWLTDGHHSYPLIQGINTIGRAPDCQIIVADGCVSRRHCVILLHHDNQCEIHDIASKNGTYLNGAKLDKPTAIRPGDEVQISGRHFLLVDKKGSSPPSSKTQVHLTPV